jgi:hypothetical protein
MNYPGRHDEYPSPERFNAAALARFLWNSGPNLPADNEVCSCRICVIPENWTGLEADARRLMEVST